VPLVYERPAGKVAVHHHLEGVVVQARKREVPIIIVGFIQKIEPVQALHPPHSHPHVQSPGVRRGMAAHVIHELVGADDIVFRDDVQSLVLPSIVGIRFGEIGTP